MPLKNFIKENFVLVVGLALPMLLVVLFLAATALPRAFATPPQYEVLFTETRYDNQYAPYNVDFFIKDGQLKAHLWKNAAQTGGTHKKLMAYNAKTDTVRELPYDLSKIGDVTYQKEVVFNEFKGMKVESSYKAPDGYAFENVGYGGDGLVMDLFGGGSRGPTARITKGAAVFRIPDNDKNYYYNDIQFLGWIIQEQG